MKPLNKAMASDFLDLPENRQKRKECVQYIVEQIIRRILPISLRATAKKFKDRVQAERLIEAALRCENEGTRDAAINARDICRAAAYADAALRAKARDKILNIAAEICVEACVKAKTPGSKWLDITEEAAA